MTLDRAPAHLADMLGFVRELRAIASAHTQDAFVVDRILNLATEKLFSRPTGRPRGTARSRRRAAAACLPAWYA